MGILIKKLGLEVFLYISFYHAYLYKYIIFSFLNFYFVSMIILCYELRANYCFYSYCRLSKLVNSYFEPLCVNFSFRSELATSSINP